MEIEKTVPGLFLWDADAGRLRRHMGDRFGAICNLCLAPDGKTAVCENFNADDSVFLVDLVAGKRVRDFGPQRRGADDAGVSGIQLSPNGKVVAVASIDIALYETATGRLLRRFGNWPEDAIMSMAFSPDGKTLVCSVGNGRMYFWDAQTGKRVRELRHPLAFHLCFSPDGARLVVVTRGFLFVRDASSGKTRWTARVGEPWGALAFAPDGKTLARGSADGRITLLEAETGKRVRSWKAHTVGTACLAFRRDGRRLASGGRDGVVRVWDPSTGADLLPLPGHRQAVTEVACSPDGKFLLSASLDCTVRLWDAGRRREVRRFTSDDGGQSVAFSANGEACGWVQDGRPRWVRPRDQSLRVAPGPAQYYAARLSPDGRRVVCLGGRGLVDAWDPLAQKWERLHKHTEPGWLTGGGTLSAQAGTAAWWMGHDMAAVCAIARHKELELDTGTHNRGGVLELNAEGTLLLEHNVLWDLRTQKKLAAVAAGVDSKAGAFSPTGRLFAVIDGRQVRVFETASGALVRAIDAGGIEPQCLAFLPDSRRLVTGNADSTLLVWDLSGGAGGPGAGKRRRYTRAEQARLWQGLAADAGTAYRAVWALAAAPEDATALLRPLMRPARPVPPGRLKKLIADLDDDAFDVRQRATADLARLGFAAADSLRKALRRPPSPESRTRVADLLRRLPDSLRFPEHLRQVRAIDLLEHLATPDARGLLERMAAGAPDAPLTRHAGESLARLALRRR